MRKVIDLQMEFWKKDIANIEFDLQSRDEIPQLLMGLQFICRTAVIREKVFEILKQIVPKQMLSPVNKYTKVAGEKVIGLM